MKTNVIRIDEYSLSQTTPFETRVKAIVQDWHQEDLARKLEQSKMENERLMDYVFELTWRIKTLEAEPRQRNVRKQA